jgi:ABC-type multidrug transport system ATPase subunit
MGSFVPEQVPLAMALEVTWPTGTTVLQPSTSSVLIGRLPDCTVQVLDVTISGHQGSLRCVDGTWTYLDDGSTNGTWREGVRVSNLAITGATELALGGQEGPSIHLRPVQAVEGRSFAPPAPLLLSQPEGATTSTWWKRDRGSEAVKSFTIGRAAEADYRVDDMLASRLHARLELLADGSARVVDLDSVNGTFVDGVAASPTSSLREGQRVTVGNTSFLFDGIRLGSAVAPTSSVFSVDRLTTNVQVGTILKTLLSDVSFALPRGSLMAVLGPSGAGKSTLLGAITGTRPATSGSVIFNGLDLYRNFGEVRHRIGFVPQEDILHPMLTIRTALRHAARLRFPADTTQSERDARIEVVLRQLNLVEHAAKQIVDLSGGQRKRVNVALELLSEPDLLILDEPTSGLDPGNERSVMEQLRALADAGRTVIVVSHSTESLHLCDQVLLLAPGGRVAFQGPVSAALGFLKAADYPQAFQLLERDDPDQLRRNFLASEWFAAAKGNAPAASLSTSGEPSARPSGQGWAVAHYRTFVGRYIDVLRGDRRSLTVLALQAPVMAVLMLAVFGSGRLTPGPESSKAGNVLMALVLAAIYMGASNSAREIVKERAILRREQSFGVSLMAYVASKATVLGFITVLQSFVLVYVGMARQGGPADAVLFGPATFELFIAVSICGISAMMLGLLVSASVSSTDKATTILPVMLFAQFLLAGLTFPVDGLGVAQLSWLNSARWGLGAVASTADFPFLSNCRVVGSPTYGICGSLWDHALGDWSVNMLALVVLTVAFGVLAYVRLRRDDPARSLSASR